jgi:hypothetical protein
MSDAPLFGGVGSRERLLWQAVLRLDDREIGDQLFALVAHQRMSRADAELVAREFSHLISADAHRRSPLLLASLVPCSLLLLFVILSVLELRDATPFDLTIFIFLISITFSLSPLFLLTIPSLLTRGQSRPHLPDGLLWAECHACFPQLLESLRANSFVKQMPMPAEWHIVRAISEVISQADKPSTSDGGAAFHAIPPSTVSLFRELLNQLPRDIDASEMLNWLKSLDSNDWHARFLVRYAIRMVGISALHALEDKYALRDWAPIAHRIHEWRFLLQQDNRAYFPFSFPWMCMRCLTRFATHKTTSDGWNDYKYNGCRSCKNSRYARKVTQSVCVIDRQFATDNIQGVMIDSEGVLHRDPVSQSRAAPMIPWPSSTSPRILLMPWSPVQRTFDFELLYIGDTDDQEIEQFIAKCLADSDKVRIGLLSTIAVRIAHPERLSANSLNLVRRLFPRSLGTPGNPADIAKLDSLIAWTAPAVAAEVLS